MKCVMRRWIVLLVAVPLSLACVTTDLTFQVIHRDALQILKWVVTGGECGGSAR